MEILETLLDIGIDMLDGFALLYLCRSMLKECRIKRTWVYYLFALPIAAVIFVYNHYFTTVGGMVVTLLFMLATVLALFRDKIRYRILWFCVAQVIPFAIDLTVSKAILETCLHRSTYELITQGGPLVFYLYALMTRFIILAVDVFIAHRRLSTTLTEKDWLNFAIIPVLSIVANMFVMSESVWGSLGQVPAVIIGTLILIINVFAYRQLLHVSENAYALAQEKAQARIEAYKVEQYHRLIQQHDATRGWKHDMKNHLLMIDSLSAEYKNEQIHDYISKISDELSQTQTISSSSSTISSLLNSKKLICDDSDITFDLQLDFNNIYISDFTLITILGNILDNAITAASKTDNGYIRLSISQADTYLSIHCENNHNEKIKKREGRFISSKPSTGLNSNSLHGLGIISITNAVEKSGGTLDINYNESVFSIDILIPNYI